MAGLERPLLLTQGDPAGIGPELTLQAWLQRDKKKLPPFAVLADPAHLEEVAKATEVACEAGADFVKTSTGFYTGGESKGATTEVIRVMLEAAKGRCKVKGSGGIRDQAHFFELIDLGIDRMGIGYRSTPVVLGLTAAQAAEARNKGGY